MTMSWLKTIQEAGTPISKLGNLPAGIAFDLTSRWIAAGSGAGNEPPPHPNCFGTSGRWPRVVEIRRPDGTRLSAEAYLVSVHLNFAYEIRNERDAAGRVRNPWRQQIVLRGVSVEEVPPGSEVWGELPDEEE
jgi:hypothetical protein